MKSPAGWALSGMWYDRYPGVPAKGSPLESLFTLVYLQRRDAELLGIRALVQVNMPADKSAQDPAIEAFQKYCDTMFPFIKRAANLDKEKEHEKLMEFVKHPVKFSLKPIWKAQAEQARRLATSQNFAIRPTVPGAPYIAKKKKVRHTQW